jgi:hypothetical protein
MRRDGCEAEPVPSLPIDGLAAGDVAAEASGEPEASLLGDKVVLGIGIGAVDIDGRGVAVGAGVVLGDGKAEGVGVGATQSGSMVKRTTRCST